MIANVRSQSAITLSRGLCKVLKTLEVQKMSDKRERCSVGGSFGIRLGGFVAATVLQLLACRAHAALPLTIEDITTARGELRTEVVLAYSNVDRTGLLVGQPVTIQTGPTSFVSLPSYLAEARRNVDSLAATALVRYGLSRTVELQARVSGFASSQRGPGADASTVSDLADAWVGVTHSVRDDGDGPGVLVFGEAAVVDRQLGHSASLRSFAAGALTYRAIDPVVLSLTSAVQYSLQREVNGGTYRPGSVLVLAPSVAFAANDRITLSAGVQWTRRDAARVDGRREGYALTRTDLLGSVNFGIDARNAVSLALKANVSGQAGADLRLGWLTKW